MARNRIGRRSGPGSALLYFLCLILALIIGLVLTACGESTSARRAPTATPTVPPLPTVENDQRASAYLNQLAAAGQLRGAVLLARGDTVLISRGYGPADEDAETPNTPHTRFRIGSVTKQVTAMAILILQERGKLSVQDHLCQYIDACPAAWRDVTLHQLLTHTSGMPDYTSLAGFSSLIGEPATPQQLIARFKDLPLNFVPGARWSYSNSNYVLLGYIVERVSGLAWAAFLRQNIFDPLGMSATGYDDSRPHLPDHATGYLKPHRQPDYIDMTEAYAAGGLYSTVEDLHRWDRALQSGRLVSRTALDAMFRPVACASGSCGLPPGQGYGYGWYIGGATAHPLIAHPGRIDGFLSFNGFFPSDGVDVIVLSNIETTDVSGIALHLGEMALSGA
jgi:CubicO group peptidase (beta-lactamase class C family)